MFPWRVLEGLSTLPCPSLLRSAGPSGCSELAPDSTEMSHSRLASTAEGGAKGFISPGLSHSSSLQLPCKEVELVLYGALVWFSAIGKFGFQVLKATLRGPYS